MSGNQTNLLGNPLQNLGCIELERSGSNKLNRSRSLEMTTAAKSEMPMNHRSQLQAQREPMRAPGVLPSPLRIFWNGFANAAIFSA